MLTTPPMCLQIGLVHTQTNHKTFLCGFNVKKNTTLQSVEVLLGVIWKIFFMFFWIYHFFRTWHISGIGHLWPPSHRNLDKQGGHTRLQRKTQRKIFQNFQNHQNKGGRVTHGGQLANTPDYIILNIFNMFEKMVKNKRFFISHTQALPHLVMLLFLH